MFILSFYIMYMLCTYLPSFIIKYFGNAENFTDLVAVVSSEPKEGFLMSTWTS